MKDTATVSFTIKKNKEENGERKVRKMYKKITVLVVTVCMMAALTGCSMFAGDKEEKNDDKSGGVKISDSFTHEDPEGLEFDKRVVVTVPSDSLYLQDIKDQIGAEVSAMKTVVYAKDDTPVACYEYTTLASEDDVKTFTAYMDEMGMEYEVDGTMTTRVKNSDSLEAEIAAYVSMNMMPDETLDSYLNIFVESFGAVIEE